MRSYLVSVLKILLNLYKYKSPESVLRMIIFCKVMTPAVGKLNNLNIKYKVNLRDEKDLLR